MDSILNRLFGRIMTYAYPYPRPLPKELKNWHLHTVDQGHCIAVAVASLRRNSDDPGDFLVPMPVRAVQRFGYEVHDGYVVCDVDYDLRFGVREDLSPDLEFEGVDPDE